MSLGDDQRAEYERDGFTIVRSLLTSDEARFLYDCARDDDVLEQNSYELLDAEGHRTRLALWYTPGDDVYGRLTRRSGPSPSRASPRSSHWPTRTCATLPAGRRPRPIS